MLIFTGYNKIKKIINEYKKNIKRKIGSSNKHCSENVNKAFDYSKIKSDKIKDLINEKIREKAILATKARLIERHKTFDDYTNDELEIIIEDEERKIIEDLKTKSLVLALAALGINFFV